MSPDDREGNEALEALIARYLEAEKSGQSLDRDGLIEEHPDLASSLREFFANHDRMKAAASLDEPTLAPDETGLEKPTFPAGQGAHEEATMPPQRAGAEPTLPPTEGGPQSSEPTVGDQVRYFGDYELLQEIARGGMGIVFKARQTNLNRTVALKMILAGQFAGEEDVQRFYTEAEAAAALDHPGIVPIFEIGEHAGQHYFSMGYIEGESLAQRVADGPLPPLEAAELVKKICDAMAYAHERGVIHRDLKPANILIDRNGQPKVTDFGLAKKTEAGSSLTGTGQILGTPAYMPPEQASGRIDDVGPLADLYSLGAILYCLLTGRPPFQAASPMDTLLQVLNKEPISPRQLNSALPVDLETICLKCLSKESSRRYYSSHDLSEELQRYLDGKPVLARPVGRVDRSWRWCKRNPTTAALIVLSAFLLLSGSAFSTHFALASKRDASLALGAKILAEQNAAEAIAAKSLAEMEKTRADQEAAEALAEKARADVQRDLAREQEEKAAWRLYANQIASAQREWDSNNVVGAKQQLNECRWDLRGWEHDYLYTQFARVDDVVVTTAPVPGIQMITCVAYSPDGRRIASGNSNGSIQICDTATGRQQLLLSGDHRGRISGILFSSDGSRIITGSSGGRTSLVVWDAVTGKQMNALGDGSSPIGRVGSANGSVRCVAFSPDESKVIACYGDGTLKTWDIATGAEIKTLARRSGGARRAAISPNGQRFATGSSRELTIWNSQGALFSSLETKSDLRSGSFLCLAFSPDGQTFVSAGYGKIKIWDSASGRLSDVIRVKRAIHCVAFSPDGKRLVGGANNGTLTVWDVFSGRQLITLKGHVGTVEAVAFSPDGSKLASGGLGRSIVIWDATVKQTLESQGPKQRRSLAISPDGKWIVSGDKDKSLIVWDAETGEEIKTLPGHQRESSSAAVSPDGKLLASGSWQYDSSEKQDVVPGELKVWDLESGRENFAISLRDPLDSVYCVAFSPNGKLVAGGLRRTSKLWDVATGKEMMAWKGGGGCLAFNPDGTRLAIGNYIYGPQRAKVYDVASGRELVVLKENEHRILSIAFSPDGKRILTAGGNANSSKPAAELILWDAETGRALLSLRGHAKAVHSAAFSPDARQIVSVGDGLRVWDAATGQQTLSLSMINGYGSQVAFTPDATRIICGATILDASKRQMNADLAEVIHRDVWKRVSIVNGRHLSHWELGRFAEICQKFPEPTYFQTLGAAQYRAGQYELAIESLEQAARRKPGLLSFFRQSKTNPARLALLTMSHFQLGNINEANDFHQQLIETMKLAKFDDSDESKRLLDEVNDILDHAEGEQN